MTESDRPSPGARVFAYILLVVGGLWILLSGGCTLTVLGMGLSDLRNGEIGTLLTFLMIGAVCILPGIGLFYGGLVILRKRKR